MNKMLIILSFLCIVISGPVAKCAPANRNAESPAYFKDIGMGFRYSLYGARRTPNTKEYWLSVGDRMSQKFSGSHIECLWIVGILRDQGCFLNFPASPESELIFTAETDAYEETLAYFSENGVKVWLQVEPGMAPVDELLHLVLKRYSHHACVTGIGIDVEWHNSTRGSEGEPVSDEDAVRWLQIAKEYNAGYKLLLKHWLVEVMPPSLRQDIVFVSNSQMLPSLNYMVNEFSHWAAAFAPSDVAFQIGYNTDKPWWGQFEDPAKVIGDSLSAAMSNLGALYWVDFTAQDVFPELLSVTESRNLIFAANEWHAAADPFGSAFHYDDQLINNGVAEVKFTIAKKTEADDWHPYLELICDLGKPIQGYEGVVISYQCEADLLVKLSQSDFGPEGNASYAHYQFRLPASETWSERRIYFSAFTQPPWAPDSVTSIPLLKNHIDAIYLVPDLDASTGQSGTLKIKHLELF